MRISKSVFPQDHDKLVAMPMDERLARMYRKVSRGARDEANRKTMPRSLLDGAGKEFEMIVNGVGRPVYPAYPAMWDQNGYGILIGAAVQNAVPVMPKDPDAVITAFPQTPTEVTEAFWGREMA